jgi:hypothetical protein
VKAFGAVGDGTADDTAAIQAAITYAFVTAGGKPLFIPDGTYKLTTSLKITGLLGGRMYGAGRHKTVLQQTTANECVILADGCAYSRFSDFKLVHTAGTTTVGLFDLGGNSPAPQSNTFENLFFQRSGPNYTLRGLGLGTTGVMGSENLIINCFFSLLRSGVMTCNQNALQNQVIGGNFQGCMYGIHVYAGSVTNVSGVGFQNYWFYNESNVNTEPVPQCAAGGYDVHIFNSVADTCVIEGCRSEGTTLNSAGNGARVSCIGNSVLSVGILEWSAGATFVLNQVVASTTTGNTYKCTVAGTTGGVEPTWPAAGTVTDGGVTWTTFPFTGITGAGMLGNNLAYGQYGISDQYAHFAAGNVGTSAWAFDQLYVEANNTVRPSVYVSNAQRSRTLVRPAYAGAWNPQNIASRHGLASSSVEGHATVFGAESFTQVGFQREYNPVQGYWTDWESCLQVIGSLIGRAVSGTNQAGKDLSLAGGRATGDATPGNIVFRTSLPAASGASFQYLQTAGTMSGADRSLDMVGGFKTNGAVSHDAQGYAVMRTETAANIAAIGNAINTTGKAAGRTVFDTTNGRVMVATGANANSTWKSADGAVTVTPA